MSSKEAVDNDTLWLLLTPKATNSLHLLLFRPLDVLPHEHVSRGLIMRCTKTKADSNNKDISTIQIEAHCADTGDNEKRGIKRLAICFEDFSAMGWGLLFIYFHGFNIPQFQTL